MGQPRSNTLIWLKRGLSGAGFLAFVTGMNWVWRLREVWPRATTDPVPHPLLEALGVIIGGLYLVNKGR